MLAAVPENRKVQSGQGEVVDAYKLQSRVRRKSFLQRDLEIVVLFHELDKALPDFLMLSGLSGSFRTRTVRKQNDAERLEPLADNVTVQKKDSP